MKKQIAILATLIAASGFTAFGQDYLQFNQAGTKLVWDESTTPGVGVEPGTVGEYEMAFLWAPVATADDLSNLGNAGNFGLNGTGAASDQVATNTVASTAVGVAEIQTMLGAGWNIGEVFGGSTIIETTTSTKGSMTAYNGSAPVELAGTSGNNSGTDIEMIFIAWNASATLGSGATTFSSVADLGWSNPFNEEVGSSAGDANAGSETAVNDFGVAPTPEPTTLALAGLGGLSMLFLRRRKA
jgi:hypothetical protein